MKIVANNKKAFHEYNIDKKYEAGIILKGTEIKSIRMGKVNISDSYITIRNNEVYIVNMNISKYDKGNIFNHDEKRDRKLLLNKSEIIKLNNYIKQDGYTLVPLKVYFNKALVKVEIALGKGKKLYDKRQDLKEKDEKRRIQKALKNY